jgi:putative DNA primase/helicase
VRQSQEAITKLVSDFLNGAKRYVTKEEGSGFELVSFNPKTRDVNEVLNALRVEAHLSDELRTPCWLPGGEPAGEWLVFENGIVNVRTGEKRAHTHRLWTHQALPFEYRDDAECPVFDAYLQSVWPNDPDAHQLVKEWLGYCMTLDTRAHKGMLLLGVRRSGKSTLVHLMQKLVGLEGFTALSFDSWLRGDFSAQSLIGKRAAVFSDVRLKEGRYFGKQWDPGGLPHPSKQLLLRITGGDDVEFRKIYSTEIAWKGALPAKITIVSNEPPNFNDDTLPTRFLKLHFKIDQEKAGKLDPDLGEKLATELPGIAALCLEAYRDLCGPERKHRFMQPASGLELDRQLARARSPMLAMALECLEVSDVEAEWVSKPDAHKACKAWLHENGHTALSVILWKEEMGEHLVRAFDYLEELEPRKRFTQRKEDGVRY